MISLSGLLTHDIQLNGDASLDLTICLAFIKTRIRMAHLGNIERPNAIVTGGLFKDPVQEVE